MMMTVSAIDEALVTNKHFGSTEAIQSRNLARFRLGLQVLNLRNSLPDEILRGVAELDSGDVASFLNDPVLRSKFEHDISSLERTAYLSLDFPRYADSYFRKGNFELGPSETLTNPWIRPWPRYGRAWVLTNIEPSGTREESLAAQLRRLVTGTFTENFTGVVIPDREMLHALRRGAELLAELLPSSGSSALRHISLVGFAEDKHVDGVLKSVTGGDWIPSAVFMAPDRLADPWLTAETLFHEGLHCKLFDVVRSSSFVKDTDATVSIPWRLTRWTFVRVIFALHVYCHLLLFRRSVEQASLSMHNRYGTPTMYEQVDSASPGSQADLEGGWCTVTERVSYLAQQARDVYLTNLTPDGTRFVNWILSTVESLAPGISRGIPSRAVAGRSSMMPIELNSRGYRRAEPVNVCALPKLGQLLAFSPDPPRFRWLNEHAWLIYALCDGGALDSLRGRYEETVTDCTIDDLSHGLGVLISAGLIEPVLP